MKPRNRPCSSCPYRRDCPSGVWAEEEYRKLLAYDGDTNEQVSKRAFGVFCCHQGTSEICAGWAAVHGDYDCLALRVAASMDPAVDVKAVLDYTTDVPLWPSGTAAAEHGLRDIENTSPAARETVRKISTVRRLSGNPVKYRE